MAETSFSDTIETYKNKLVEAFQKNTWVVLIVIMGIGLVAAWFIWGRKSKYADRARSKMRSMANKLKVMKSLKFRRNR